MDESFNSPSSPVISPFSSRFAIFSFCSNSSLGVIRRFFLLFYTKKTRNPTEHNFFILFHFSVALRLADELRKRVRIRTNSETQTIPLDDRAWLQIPFVLLAQRRTKPINFNAKISCKIKWINLFLTKNKSQEVFHK